jgi:hypothetical protein
MEWSPVAIAFALTLLAGLATGIGSALALFARTTNTRFLSAALGFSAGVMIYVSFVEILADARAGLAAHRDLRGRARQPEASLPRSPSTTSRRGSRWRSRSSTRPAAA